MLALPIKASLVVFLFFLITVINTLIFWLPDNMIKKDNNDFIKISSENVKTWSYDYIQSINITNTTCPYGTTTLILDRTPQTVRACDCSKGRSFNYTYEDYRDLFIEGECGDDCIYSLPVMSYNLTRWRSSMVCVTTVNNYTANILYNKSEKCPAYLQDCGAFDSLGNKLCKSGICPVTDIKILPKNQAFSPIYKNYYKQVFGDGEMTLLTTNTYQPNGRIIANISVSRNNLCAHPLETDISKNKNYLLYKNYQTSAGCNTAFNGTIYNPFYKKIDSYSGQAFFSENNVLRYYENLPLFPKLYHQENEFNLYLNYYPGVNPKCLKNTRRTFLAFNEITQRSILNQKNNITYVTIPSFVINMVIFFIYCLSLDDDLELKSKTYYMTISIFIVNLIQFIAVWIILGESVNFYVRILEKNLIFPLKECLDAFLYDHMLYVKEGFSSYQFTYLIVALLSTFFMQVLIIFCFVFRCYVNKIFRDENF
jgi:hypothetical protein